MITDDEFLKLINEYEISYKKGDLIKGTVVGYEGNDVLVDINAKTNAICPVQEVLISKDEQVKDILKLGENYEFVVVLAQDEDGVFYLSHRKVALKQNLGIIEEKFKNNETVIGKIVGQTKGGNLVNVFGIKGFIPSSQMKNIEVKIGSDIELKILSFDSAQNNFILSNKKVYEDERLVVKKETLEKIELNMVVKGKIVRLTDFGAFVDIGGIDALLPLSQISWSWIEKPSDVLVLDDVIEVEIIGIDKDKQRVSLSLKTLQDNPWLDAQKEINVGQEIKGKVIALKSFGAFVEVFPKVEGLLSKAQCAQYLRKYEKEINLNDEINVVIKKFDADNQKIVLDVV